MDYRRQEHGPRHEIGVVAVAPGQVIAARADEIAGGGIYDESVIAVLTVERVVACVTVQDIFVVATVERIVAISAVKKIFSDLPVQTVCSSATIKPISPLPTQQLIVKLIAHNMIVASTSVYVLNPRIECNSKERSFASRRAKLIAYSSRIQIDGKRYRLH